MSNKFIILSVLLQLLNSSCKDINNLSPSPDEINHIYYKKTKLDLTLVKKYGIDVSHYNGFVVDSITIKDSLSFVICKATEGLEYVDRMFNHNWREISKKGLIKGGYHFYLANFDPVKQAEHYLKTIGKLLPNDFGPIVDVEQGSLRSISKSDLTLFQNNLLQYLATVEKKTNKTPMIYTNLDFADRYLTHIEFSKYHLWIGEYTEEKHPKLPKVWKNFGYTVWQQSDSHFIKSIRVDLDIANY